MDSMSKEIGSKIRALRLSRHLTQSSLAGDCITRNMLSLIENGNAAPSLSTLSALAERLEVPVGYFFAADDEEVSQFMKMSLIGKIRVLFASAQYSECLQLCASLAHPDDEIRLIAAECHLALAQEFCRDSALTSASLQLEKAADAARHCVYSSASICSTVEYMNLLIRSVNLPEVPAELSEPGRYPASRIPPEMFVYLSALRALETGNAAKAEVLLSSSLIHSPLYLDFLSAKLVLLQGDHERAGSSLRRLLASPSIGFFTFYHALTAMELCASTAGDFKTAYHFSTQKIHLLEQFTK